MPKASTGAANSLTEAADMVAKYIEDNRFTYSGAGSTDYSFPIIGSSFRTLSCSSFIQECLVQAGYDGFRGPQFLFAEESPEVALSELQRGGVNAEMIGYLSNLSASDLQPGDLLFTDWPHVVMCYAINGDQIQYKGVQECLNPEQDSYGSGFDGQTRSISSMGANGFYAIRVQDSGRKILARGNNNTESGEKIYEDSTMFKGSLDLKKTGLTKDDLRFMILASYVTQATTDTVVGIEIPDGEDDSKKAEIIVSPDKKGDGWISKKIDNYNYYGVKVGDDYKFFQTEQGIVKILDENNNPIGCYSNEHFSDNLSRINSHGAAGARSYQNDIFYTVPEIGKIKVLSISQTGDEYSFSEEVKNYANESEISSAMIPLELLVDFLNISASSDFMNKFEELVKNQEIVIKVTPRTVTTVTEVETTQDGEASAHVRGNAHFKQNENPTASSSGVETLGYDSEFDQNVDLGSININNYETTTTTNITYNAMLEKANTWFMRAQRDIKASTNTTVNTVEDTIPGEGIVSPGTGAFSADRIGEGNSAALNGALSLQNVLNMLGISAKFGYQLSPNQSNIEVVQSELILHEGKKETTRTTTTHTYNKGTMKYDDNTDAFLGLWKNKDGQYHKYAPKYDSDGKIVGVAEEACFDPEGKKVGYSDLYGDKKAYVGDLFVNADIMLFELLEMSENTQATSNIMKYILYRYTGTSYGVTNFDILLKMLGINVRNAGSDYNVKTDTVNGQMITPTKDQLKMAFESTPYADVLLGDLDKIYEVQEKYKVNGIFTAAVQIIESSAGTDLSGGYGAGSCCRFSLLGVDSFRGYDQNGRDQETENFARLISREDGYYFGSGNFTVSEIGKLYCDDEWSKRVKAVMSDMFSATGIKASIGTSDVVDFALQFEGMLQSEIPGFLGCTLSDGSITVYVDEWCAMFMSWCFDQCGLIPSKIPRGVYSVNDDDAMAAGKYRARGTYTPNPGDLIYFDYDGDGTDHVAIVVESDGNSVTWVGGNQGGGGSPSARHVTKGNASLDWGDIDGYWDMSD